MLNNEDSQKVIKKNIERREKQVAEKLLDIEKSFPNLNDDDIAFIKARREYLSPKQEDLFASVLANELSYDELKEMAKELGIKTSGVKKEELKKLVEEAQR